MKDVVIKIYQTELEAQLAKTKLDSANIKCVLDTMGFLGEARGGISRGKTALRVLENDAQKAKELLNIDGEDSVINFPTKTKRILTLAFIPVIIILLVVIGALGGSLIPKKVFQSSAPQNDNQTAGWKTYTNSEYGFEFKYPANAQITNESSNGYLNLKITSGAPNYISRSLFVGDSGTYGAKYGLNDKPNTELKFFNSVEKIGDITWTKREDVYVPKNGLGTYSDRMNYVTGKNNLVYYINCTDCVPPPDGGGILDPGFTDFVSTFKFTK